MLAWLQSALPKCEISNFSSSWNDGVALHALIEYCSPGTCPDWEKLDKTKKLENCRNAMNIAKDKFDIPLVVRPEDMASHHLDELSGMTYLSYYMKQDSPGYYATLNRVCKMLQRNINNFTTDWNDGQLICELVRAVGGKISNTSGTNEEVLKKGLYAGKELGFKPLMSAKEIAAEKEEHLGIMAYAAQFLDKKPMMPGAERITMNAHLKNVHVGNETIIHMNIVDSNVSQENIQVNVTGPDSKLPVHMSWTGQSGIVTFIPTETGQHTLTVLCDGQIISGCPKTFKVNADRSKVSYLQIENCCVGTITEVKVNAVSAGQGSVRVEAKSPSGHVNNLPVMSRNGIYNANFTPSEVGNWKMSVYYDGEHISGSPFDVNVFDPAQVQIYGIDGGTVGKELNFKVDCCHAGKGDLQVKIKYKGRDVPLHISEETNAIYKVNFTPQGAGLYEIKGLFNDAEIKGSPYTLEIVDSNMVSVSGSGLEQVAVNKLASFHVNTKGAGGGDVKVEIKSPSNQSLPVDISKNNQVHSIQFTPKISGIILFISNIMNRMSQEAHIHKKVFDVDKVSVSNMPKTYEAGKYIHFDIDASQAGSGNLEIQVNGGRVPCYVKNLGNHKFSASFVPVTQEHQIVQMSFNELKVKGSPWIIKMVDTSKFTILDGGTKYIAVKTLAKCTILGPDSALQNLKINVTAPWDKSSDHKSTVQADEKLQVEFLPEVVGSHKVDISYGGSPLKQSPIIFKVFDANAINLSKIPEVGLIGENTEFTIDTSKCGDGDLKILINNGELQNKVEKISKNTYSVSFVPVKSGPHQIDVTFNNVPVHDSPYTYIVQNTDQIELSQMKKCVPCNSCTDFIIKQPDAKEISVRIMAPNNALIPTRMIPQYDGDYKVEWTPTISGCYFIDVHFGGHQIQGSPFTVDVFDINKVNVDALSSSNVGEQAKFVVNYSSAGQAEYAVKIVSPSGQIIPFDGQEKNNKIAITYIPTEPGKYKIYVTYGGIDIPGTPIIQEIGEGGMPTAHGDGLYKGEEDKPAIFYVDASELKGDLFVQVDGPNSIAKCNIDPEANGIYTVTYVPVEVGLYDVQVKWNSKEIQGSPFHPKIVNARKVRVVGGWQHFMDSDEHVHLVVDEMKKIPFDISEAGPGKLTAEVQDPNNIWLPVHIDTSSDGKNILAFIPKAEGNHLINVYWTEHPLVGAPFLGNAVVKYPTAIHDNSQVTLSGRGLKEAVVREEAEFYIDGSKAGPGKPEVTLTGVRSEIDIIKKHLGNGRYYCTYIPVLPGGYLLHITWNNRQLKGSPYKVSVIAAAQPQKVNVTGEGLEGGILGKELQVNIDTRKAGPGELTAHCMGPTRIAYCELTDNNDGIYKLTIRPQEPGRHILQIKYGGENVLGSPYVLKIGALPDASKVRVSGPGVEHGILATFQSHFLVETDGAGAGKLTVRIRGPKGAFQVHMSRESQRDRKIVCHYDPFETGLYIIQVKWSDINVPGSPFHVQIVDTHQEYEAISQEALSLHNGYTYSESLPHRSSYNQWREDI
ncbi:FLNA [Acanthosepion pharaonis]|uniref:FLNA n=1 Tax=Acanthosepion pharaonis TaxID=158019 RepID=A0A812CNU7_ACAPH|nr:FLNA [Sepia pharaonis]